jgi:hypothetical protein
MPIVKSKSKFDESTCQYEKDGMKCSNKFKKDDEYLYDTDAKKGYCMSHEELNKKAVENKGSGGGYGGRGNMPLCRDANEGLDACQKFNEAVVPMIQATQDKFKKEGMTDLVSPEKVFEAYLSIFVGKFPTNSQR